MEKEKIKIKSVIDSGKKWNDKSIFTVELEDGRRGSSFEPDSLSWKIDSEIELDVRDGKEYQGQKQYIFSLPKPAGQKGGFPQKDYTFEKRRASLENSINAIKLTEQKGTSVNIIALANDFFTYLNQK